MVKSNSKSLICLPAMLYLILALIGLISMAFKSCGFLCLFVNVLFIGIWTWFLNFLCSQGYTTISWILVLLPFIIFILMILFVIELMKINNVKENFANTFTASGLSESKTANESPTTKSCEDSKYMKIKKECDFKDADTQNKCDGIILKFAKEYCKLESS